MSQGIKVNLIYQKANVILDPPEQHAESKTFINPRGKLVLAVNNLCLDSGALSLCAIL